MTDVELRLTADLDQATKEVAGFRKEYQEMVKAVEKPLRQVDALQKTQESAKAASTAYFGAKRRVEELRDAIAKAGQPVRELDRAYAQAQRTLVVATREFERQKSKVREQRDELRRAGVDTRRLADEQQRLARELGSTLAAGRNDQAVAGIRARAAALAQVTREQRAANIEASRENLGVNRYRALQAEIQRSTQQYELLRRSGKLTAQELAVAQQQLTQRVRESKQALQELAGQQSSGGIFQAVGSRLGVGGGAAAGVAGGVALAAQYAAAVDPIKKMDAQLKLATKSQEEFSRAQAATFRIAQENQAPLADVVTLYSRLTPALRDVGRGQGDAIQIIDAVTKSLRISGATAQETASTIQQFSQALGSGVLRGEEFNTLAESSPRLLRALADGLNVNVGALRAMAAEGQLTADVISDALIGQLSKLTEEAASLPDTFGGAVTKLTNALQAALGKFDEATGVSGRLIERINTLTGAINLLASGSGEKAVAGVSSLSLELARLVPAIDLAFSASERFLAMVGIESATSRLKEMAEEEEKVYDFREERLAARAAKMLKIQKQASDDNKKLLEQQVKDTEAALKDQVAAERKAAGDLEKAKQAQLDTQKRYQDALASLNAGVGGEASYGQAESLKVAARGALRSGDVEGAKRQAQAALAVLQELARAGQNTYGFEGFIKELQAIEEAADQRGVEETKKSLEQAKAAAAQTKAALDELKDVKVAPTLDAEAQQKLLSELADLAKRAGVLLTIPATVTVQGGGTVDASLPAAATGGILRGPGTGTSDSILARLSNGEGIINARAVQHYGAGLIHQLNALRLPRFATGGVYADRPMPSIPALAPALQQQLAGPNFPDLGSLQLDFGGQTTTVYVDQAGALNLQRLAMKKGGTRRK